MRAPAAHCDETRQLRIAGHGAQPLVGSALKVVAEETRDRFGRQRGRHFVVPGPGQEQARRNRRQGRRDNGPCPHRSQQALVPQMKQIAGRHDHGQPRHQQGDAGPAHHMIEVEDTRNQASEQRGRQCEEIDEVARQRIDRRPVDDRRFLGNTGEPAGVEDRQQHDGGHREHQACEQPAPLHRARAKLGERRPGRHRERIGAEQPDQIGQDQDGDHEQRIERIERHQHAAPPLRGNGKSGEQQQQSGCGGRRQQQKPGLDRPGEPRVAPVLADQLPGMQQKQRP